jgi:hypothetical protein
LPNQNDRHLTTEELSALLDEQLSNQERIAFEEHLTTCQQCRGMLNDLRQTVALLHALPVPALPRSFALPLNTKFTPADEPVPADAPIQLAQHRNQKRSRLPVVFRTLSTIAAVIGVAFLLTGVFHSTNQGVMMSNSSGTTASSSAPQSTAQQAPAHRTPNTGLIPKADSRTGTPQITSVPHDQATQATVQPSQPQPTVPGLLDPTLPGGQLAIGVILLVLAAAGLLTLNLLGKKSRAP